MNSLYRSEAKLVSAGIDLYFRDPHGDLVGFFDNQATQRPDLITIAKTQCNVAPAKILAFVFIGKKKIDKPSSKMT